MAKQLKCNSCGGIYPSPEALGGVFYAHACPDEVIDTPEVTDADHKIITPVKRKPTPNPRNENFRHNPDKPGEFVITAEGSGVTEL